ncbi:hypothetical protein BO78DRAFT_225998 [Aspergillus sclerotiicarbonarius CBS 121057]|uniref:Uncharacterized protein n=1 Tax=Aspergillus sclerotiicarbonarius (strain CBS 121057 / IBT 28362) TaxID=1448318 RepID=A0A319DWI7_ASPSB|nr:hypothetical protein BO78DRAFT_225998 [Aspergillus sclerotiicarbonarius CBS 121057]
MINFPASHPPPALPVRAGHLNLPLELIGCIPVASLILPCWTGCILLSDRAVCHTLIESKYVRCVGWLAGCAGYTWSRGNSRRPDGTERFTRIAV